MRLPSWGFFLVGFLLLLLCSSTVFSGREVSVPQYSSQCPLFLYLVKPLTLTWQSDSALIPQCLSFTLGSRLQLRFPSHHFGQIFTPPFLTCICLSLSRTFLFSSSPLFVSHSGGRANEAGVAPTQVLDGHATGRSISSHAEREFNALRQRGPCYVTSHTMAF